MIPDSAHGTNPATAAVVRIPGGQSEVECAQGMVDVAELERMVDEDTGGADADEPFDDWRV